MSHNRDDDYKRDIRLEHSPPPHHPTPHPIRRPNRFWLLVLSPLPGLSHMYLGLIRRGLFYITALALLVFFTTAIAPSAFVILTSFAKLALFATAFFESFAIRRDIVMGKDVRDTIPSFEALKRNKAIFVAILILAAVVFGVNILSSLDWYVWLIFGIVAIVFLVFGRSRKNDDNQ